MYSARRLSALAAPVVIAAVLSASAPAARAVTVDFSSDNDFANNFHAYPVSGGTYAQSAATGNLTWTTTGSQTGAFVYDTNGATADGVVNFVPGAGSSVTVDFDFSTSVDNSSVGVYFGGSRSSELLALFNVNNSGAQDQTRIFSISGWNATNPAVNGNTTTSANQSQASGGWTTNTTYHVNLTIAYTSASAANVTLTVSDRYTVSNPLASFSVTATNQTVSSTLNEIGFRTGMGGSAGVITLDNIAIATSAIPEPSSFAALGGLAVLACAALRRRRA